MQKAKGMLPGKAAKEVAHADGHRRDQVARGKPALVVVGGRHR